MINQLEARANDWIKKSEDTNSVVLSSFLNEDEQYRISKMYDSIAFFGGYENSIRKKAAFGKDLTNVNFKITCLVASVNTNYAKVSHRDILGALMALNIDRNRFGDCFYQDNRIIVYVDDKISEYIIDNCTSVGRVSVKFERSLPINQIQKYSYLNISVPSLRVDVIVAALMPCSRAKVVEVIAEKRVVLNYKIVEETSRLCNNGDIISIKGIGKFKIDNTKRTTRKGRLIINVVKFE